MFKICLMFLFWGRFIKASGWFSARVGRMPGCAWCTQAPARGPRGSPTCPWLFLHQNPCSITHLKPPFGASMHHPPIFEGFLQWYLEEHRGGSIPVLQDLESVLGGSGLSASNPRVCSPGFSQSREAEEGVEHPLSPLVPHSPDPLNIICWAPKLGCWGGRSVSDDDPSVPPPCACPQDWHFLGDPTVM